MIELQQSDINTLLNTLKASQASGIVSDSQITEVKLYDFAQAENMPGDFVRVLENINRVYARSLGNTFTSLLNATVQVEMLSVEEMTFRQFCHQIPEQTVIGSYSLEPLEGLALLELNPHLAWHLLDRCLGGTGEIADLPQVFSPIERGLLEELLRRILRELGKAWESLVPVQFQLSDLASNTTSLRHVQADDRMVVSSFGITLQDLNGLSTYCLPVSSLDFEWLLDPEKTLDEDVRQVIMREHQKLMDRFALVPVNVRACLPDTKVPIEELYSLREGDVLLLNAEVDEPIEIRIEHERCLSGRPVHMGTKMAVEVLCAEETSGQSCLELPPSSHEFVEILFPGQAGNAPGQDAA